jgi:hypothetical protein
MFIIKSDVKEAEGWLKILRFKTKNVYNKTKHKRTASE